MLGGPEAVGRKRLEIKFARNFRKYAPGESISYEDLLRQPSSPEPILAELGWDWLD